MVSREETSMVRSTGGEEMDDRRQWDTGRKPALPQQPQPLWHLLGVIPGDVHFYTWLEIIICFLKDSIVVCAGAAVSP